MLRLQEDGTLEALSSRWLGAGSCIVCKHIFFQKSVGLGPCVASANTDTSEIPQTVTINYVAGLFYLIAGTLVVSALYAVLVT
jgi:hypothetical protein